MSYLRRGLGAVCANGLSPSTTWEWLVGCVSKMDTAGESIFDTGSALTAWWCNNTGLCPASTLKASQALANPDVAYPPMAQPPAVIAPGNLTTPPASGANAQQSVNDVLTQQMQAWQAQNQRYFNEVGACDPGIDPTCGGGPSGTPWGLIAIVAAVAVLGISVIGGGPPRYGR